MFCRAPTHCERFMKTHGWGWLLQTAGMNNCSIVKDDWQYSSAFLYDISGISNPAVIVFNWNDCAEMSWLGFKGRFVVELDVDADVLGDRLWNVFFHSCFSFKSPKMGITNRMWAVSQGRSGRRSPRSRFENWRQNSPITTIWPDWGGTKSP